MVDDLLAYVDSIGEPTGLVGWSGGGTCALAVAAQSDAVTAVAPFEPGILSLADEQEQAAHRRTPSPARASWPPKGTWRLRLAPSLVFPSTTRRSPWPRTPATSRPQAATSRTCSTSSSKRWSPKTPPLTPAVLGAISAPVVVLLGSDTKPFFTASARYVADHVPNARMHEIPGAGHAAP